VSALEIIIFEFLFYPKGKHMGLPIRVEFNKEIIHLFFKFSDSEQNKVKDLKNG